MRTQTDMPFIRNAWGQAIGITSGHHCSCIKTAANKTEMNEKGETINY